MIKWIKLSETTWDFKSLKINKQLDSIEKLYVYSYAMGIEHKDIEEALIQMCRNEDHDCAEFGAAKKFILTRKL